MLGKANEQMNFVFIMCFDYSSSGREKKNDNEEIDFE